VKSLCIADFGVSTQLVNPEALSATVIGSKCYIAPEVESQKQYNPFLADIFSFGIVLSEILCGSIQDVYAKKYRTKNPQKLNSISERCTHINPTQRPTATELKRTYLIHK